MENKILINEVIVYFCPEFKYINSFLFMEFYTLITNTIKFSFFEDLIIFGLIYNFFQLLILSVLQELLWPTHFFNRRLTIGYNFVHHRVFVEFFLKLYLIVKFFNTIHKQVYKNFISNH